MDPFAAILTAVNLGNVTTDVAAIIALIAGVYVVVKGGKLMLGAIKS